MNLNFFKKKEIKEKETERVEIIIRYSYEWNDDVPNEEMDTPAHPSRPFCKKLMELKRLYTRSDIEQISERLGYSVWDRKGGDNCRHKWVPQTILKRAKE